MGNNDEWIVKISARPEVAASKASADDLEIAGIQIEGRDYSFHRINHLTVAHGSTLTRCSFQGTQIKTGGLGGGGVPSTYMRCNFDSCRMDGLLPGRARFVACSFRGATLRNMQFLEAELIDCVFDDSLIENVVFDADGWGSDPDDPPAREYSGNDFSSARLHNVAFRGGISLSSQKLPQEGNYLTVRDAAEVLAAAMGEIQGWESESCRLRAELTLGVLWRNVDRKQKDLFLEKDFLMQGLGPEYASRLVQALTKQ